MGSLQELIRLAEAVSSMESIEKFGEIVNRIAKFLTGFLTAAMALVLLAQVIFRYVLKAPLAWSEECASFAFVWMALLGASVGVKNDEHPRFDILFKKFPSRAQKTLEKLLSVPIILMLGFLLFYGVKLALRVRFERTAALGYSLSFVYMVLPLSAAIMLIHVIINTILLFRRGKREIAQ